MSVKINWKGDEVVRTVEAAAALGIDQTLSACVIDSKQNHTGWTNRTGAAEGSIRIIEQARGQGNQIVGKWGSIGIFYMLFLEFIHGSALRRSADRNYPTLKGRIKANLAAMGGARG